MSEQRSRKLIAVAQMTSTEDKEANFDIASSIVKDAVKCGSHMVFLPECFDFVARSRKETLEMLEPLEGHIISKYKQLAKESNVWLSLGGMHEKPAIENKDNKACIAHIVIDSNGEINSVYRKAHLFNLEIPGVVRLIESEFSVAGDRVEPPVQTPVGKVGLGICYDLRFPEFAIALTKGGADILTYPSAFTVPTGMAHWESLLRARAIENQVYVVAAAQNGAHNEKRSSYGHAMVIDPWGAVIAQCSNRTGFALAEIDHEYLAQCRQKLPVWTDRRPELYGNIHPPTKPPINDDEADYVFGAGTVKGFQVFHKTQMSYAFVNHRPILPGHVLVAPLKCHKRLVDLGPPELTDLFALAQKVQRAVEQEYGASSSTLAVQDGPDAGQSVEHVHIHILPRKPTDFGGNIDAIYAKLQTHDKEASKETLKLKTREEMADDALRLRKYFLL